jgi:hypothetical protein
MTTATVNSMNLLLEKPTTMVSVKIPGKMKAMVEASAASLNMNVSQYIKLAINDRLEKDFKE